MINNEHFHFQRFFDGVFGRCGFNWDGRGILDSKCIGRNEQALTCYEIHLSLSIIDFH